MRKITRTTRCRVSILLFSLMQISPVMAGDEDMSPSVYQIFDPETGYMIPVDPQTAARNNHLSSVDPASRENILAGTTQGSAEQASDASQRDSWWLGGIVALLLVGGIVLLIRKRGTAQTSVST